MEQTSINEMPGETAESIIRDSDIPKELSETAEALNHMQSK